MESTNTIRQGTLSTEDLARLRTDSLRVIGVSAGLVGYLWLLLLFWPITGQHASRPAWIGALVLSVSSLAAVMLSQSHQRLVRYLFVLGAHITAACAVLAFPEVQTAYLFTLPVIFASVLFNQWLALANAALAIALISLLSLDSLMPVAIVTLVALASWLSAYNLYSALTWLTDAYTRAYKNERVVRDRQAELQRALKALDEANYRTKRLNQMLVVARDQAEEGRRIKQYFAQTISHELRTPLNLIVGFAELMTQSPEYYHSELPPPYMRDLRTIYRNASHLQKMVNDVLDLAHIETAQMSLSLELTDPSELMVEALNTVRALVESRGLSLHGQAAADLPKVWLDPTRIRQVLFNLINNATRFTEQGGVKVSLCQEEGQLLFAVTDSGMGIAPDDLQRIFEEYYQVDGGTNRRYGGVGLGLAISRQFVALHGGRLWAESELGKGSTFYVALPLLGSDEAMPESKGLVSFTTPTTRQLLGTNDERLLLAVTASSTAAQLLTRYITSHRVVVARDLQQAQMMAQQLVPQAVIVDIALGVNDPVELTQLGRAWGLVETPLICCPLPSEEPLRRRLDVDGYLIKPVLRQNVWDILRTLGKQIESILVVDDNRDFVRLMRLMLNSPVRPYQVSVAYSGEEALALIRHRPPDLVLLDLNLPDISGMQVIEQLRSQPSWRKIAIVVVSALDDLDNLEMLEGSLSITKVNGLLPGGLVRWVQSVLETATPTGTPY